MNMAFLNNTLPKHIKQFAIKLNDMLAHELEKLKAEGAPERLIQAMAYAVLDSGKRLRPFLLAETSSLFGRQDNGILLAGCALECIHCYSLIHDDLPSMDDDETRRGKPTLHRAYDEATAILAADALQALAFELLANLVVDSNPHIRIKLITELASAAGSKGMVGGQMLDLAAEGRFQDQRQPQKREDIQHLQAMKTGALFRFACLAGAWLGHAKDQEAKILAQFGEKIGLTFQFADDLLDHIGDSKIVGKKTAKDKQAGKATLLNQLNEEDIQHILKEQTIQAQDLLSPFGDKAGTLKQIAHFITTRTF